MPAATFRRPSPSTRSSSGCSERCATRRRQRHRVKPLFIADPSAFGQQGDWRPDVIPGSPILPSPRTRPRIQAVQSERRLRRPLRRSQSRLRFRRRQQPRPWLDASASSRAGRHWAALHLGLGLQRDLHHPADTRGRSGAGPTVLQHLEVQRRHRVPGLSRRPVCEGVVALHAAGRAMSPTEGGSCATMDTDSQGNLYVPDFFNNRILRYDSPFTTRRRRGLRLGAGRFLGCPLQSRPRHQSSEG